MVLAIVALLLSIVYPRYHGSLDKAKDVALLENLRLIRVTLDQFLADNGRYPDSLDEMVDKKYLRAVPIDPVTENPRSWILVPSRDPDRKGISDIKSGAPGLAKDGRAYEHF